MAGGVVSNLVYAVGFKVANSALKKAEKQVDGLTGKVKKFGVAALAIGTAVAGIGVKSVSMATNFENSMSKVQMATGATNEQMEQTRDIATELYKQNFGDSWEDLGNSIATVQQVTGETGEELQGLTAQALLMRDAFGYDVSESVRAADTMMKNFGITSDQAFNLIAQGKQNGLDFSGELLDSLNEYSTHFSSLGFDAESMFNTLAAGASQGAFNLDKVADAVKEFGIRSKDAGDSGAVEAFELLGLNAEQMMQTFAAGGPKAQEAFSQVISSISGVNDPVKQNTIAVGLFGTQFEDLQKNVLTAMGTAESKFDMTKNTMESLNQTRIESPGQAFEAMGRQIETGLLIPLGQFLLPLLINVSKGIGFFIDHIDILGPAIAGVGVVILAALMPSIPAMWAAATAGWAMIAPWLPIIGIAVLVGAAIAGLILVFKNWGKIGPWLVEKWNQFKTWTLNIFQSIGQFFKEWGPKILLILAGPIAWIVTFIVKHWTEIKATTVGIFTGIWNWLVNIWNSITTSISNSVNGIWTKITEIWNNITGFLKGINLFEIGKNIIDGLINGIGSMANAVVDKVKDIGNSITDKVKGILGIHSPSRVMMELGYYTGEGLALGIAGTRETVEGATEEVAGGSVAAASSTPSPSLSPARTAGGGQRNINIKVDVPVTIQGNADAQTLASLRELIRQEIGDVIESAIRIAGLEGA